MANLSDMFNIVNKDTTASPSENTFQDKIKKQTKSLQDLQAKLIEGSKTKVSDIVQGKLDQLSGKTESLIATETTLLDDAVSGMLKTQNEQEDDLQAQSASVFSSTDDTVKSKGSKPSGPTVNTLQKSLVISNTTLNDTINLYNNFNPDYFTYGSRLGLAGQQFAEKALGEGEYFKDPEKAKNQAAYFQRAHTAFFNWVKEQSGAQVSDAEMQRRLKARFNPSMSPSEAKGALLNMMQEVVTHRMALKSLLNEGFSLDKEVDRDRLNKLIGAQKKLQGPQMDAYIKKFINNPHNKAAGATKMDAMMMYMYKHGLLGAGGK